MSSDRLCFARRFYVRPFPAAAFSQQSTSLSFPNLSLVMWHFRAMRFSQQSISPSFPNLSLVMRHFRAMRFSQQSTS
ncbi:hypothetical protein ACQP2U_40355 [Nocardia sp. CA-084685]|uniref:hypothetical protein n=1 Tax=Nocardia sp. CA-084685 TaxID=3239970 RepID=UPI003D98A744